MKAEQLRKAILQMAIQGKLVPQDPNDEPASVLLERIKNEKDKLIKEGKIKKDKIDSYIFKGDDNRYYEKIGKEVKDITEELLFEIPDTWGWVRLSNILSITTGNKDANQGSPNGIYDFYTCALEPIKSNTYSFDGESLILPGNGANVGVVIIYYGKFEAYQRTYVLQKITDIYLPYIQRHMEYNWREYNSDKLFGSAIPYIKYGNLANYLIALPPIEEQERIVAEVEKFEPLLAEYDKLEQQVTKLDSEIYDKLKKSILQYAIQGKLVPQDENDEPASVLLERIRAEKKAKLGKKYVESYIYKGDDNCYYEKVGGNTTKIDDLPFDIPDNWSWARLGEIFQHNTGKALNSSNTNGKKLPYITTSNVYWDRFQLSKLKMMPFTEAEVEKCTVSKGDLLVCEGGDIGRSAIWGYEYDICIQNHIHRLRANNARISNRFYLYVLYVYKHCGLVGGKGIGIQGLSSNMLDKLLIPVPPINEQIKIVQHLGNCLSKLKREI